MQRSVFSWVFLFIVCQIHAQERKNSLPQVLSESSIHEDLNNHVWSHNQAYLTKGKPPIDFKIIDNWKSVRDEVALSEDGKYIAYSVGNHNSNNRRLDTLVVQSTNNSWRYAITGSEDGQFLAKGRQYLYKTKNGLHSLLTGTNTLVSFPGVCSYKLPPDLGSGWVAFQLTDYDKTVVLHNFLSGEQTRYAHVKSYEFDASGQWLWCQVEGEKRQLILHNVKTGRDRNFSNVDEFAFGKSGMCLVVKTAVPGLKYINTKLVYVNLVTGKKSGVWESDNHDLQLVSFSLNANEKEVVFILGDSGHNTTPSNGALAVRSRKNSIWYWAEGSNAELLVPNDQREVKDEQIIGNAAFFTDDGRFIQFVLEVPEEKRSPMPGKAQVDVWSYHDKFLQSMQPHLENQHRQYKAVINLKNRNVVLLENEYEHVLEIHGEYAIVSKSSFESNGDLFWRSGNYLDSAWLVSLHTGERKYIASRGQHSFDVIFSPGGEYVVYFDITNGCHYFSYNLRTGKRHRISSGIPDSLLALRPQIDAKPQFSYGVAGFLLNDKGVFVYDEYDIWQLDLAGVKPPLNVTSIGSATKTVFSMLTVDRWYPTKQIIAIDEPLIVRAFNTETKYSGFYQKNLKSRQRPDSLYMAPVSFGTQILLSSANSTGAKENHKAFTIGIVKRESFNAAPNYFCTLDFKNFKQLTFLQPHTEINWLTAELHTFKQLDGTESHGILYKPQNFDSTKRYPMIITFYAMLTNGLHRYPQAEYITAPSIFKNPAWMVSHGYLVFVPDIYFKKDQWGPSTVNGIEGAVEYLRSLPYVDSNHLGVGGHSNSGRFGYYLFTHSNSFAAMSLGSGFGGTNVISVAVSLVHGGKGESGLEWAENGAYGAALGSLWENKERWIDHTAVIQADRSTSPLLLFHNKKDGDDVRLAEELFVSLRRLEKKAWWLQYDYGGHEVWKLEEQRDFTIRYTQFFDHYLKSAPAPKWMTKGIMHKDKGILSGFELDSTAKCGINCKACMPIVK
ncbi:S9 family peptidase [Longitalea luteola]|uniref:S9 family peptidase n=1 Tax=Longitalea luteola TaxID=2812563 RepID=UPI001A964E44|nr:acyl-CoA thioester hydrolase/BAAT C-terminal domain-containing protein [Longitalea luteola]